VISFAAILLLHLVDAGGDADTDNDSDPEML
jgi:hypothetical protein